MVQFSADPNMLMELLTHTPCHVAALMQLQQVAAQMGQAEDATNFLERALGVYEASYAPSFVQAWLRGEARMLAGSTANAPFFRALHKHALTLGRRGCHQAAVGTAILTLSLDRAGDPAKIKLLVDALL